MEASDSHSEDCDCCYCIDSDGYEMLETEDERAARLKRARNTKDENGS